jgi:hypothetical protein
MTRRNERTEASRMATETPDLSQRVARIERVLVLIASERYGISGLGPMDPGWATTRERARLDLQVIVKAQSEPELEQRAKVAT